MTFSALASEPVQRSLWDEASPIPHTRLGQTADLVVVVPATAHTIARYAAGLSDDLLCATLLATRAPVVVCPAMHTEMWEHPSVRENLATPASGAASKSSHPRAGAWPAATRARAGWPSRRVIVDARSSDRLGRGHGGRDLARRRVWS